ncbi:MAG: FAD-dependent oxidoreductase, partial [Clostridia bacterium]|nr:FAD-dependent oxidoreductase [Clostridia bacterium]
MNTKTCDVAVIGAGPAGLAAAVAAKENGAGKVIVIERDSSAGGILQQCIHPGFGLTRFGEELSGPEYYGRFTDRAGELGVDFMLDTMVLDLNAAEGSVYCVSGTYGAVTVKAGSVVLAMGCRERTRAGIAVPGTRPAGIYTAGAAQRLINRQNVMVGKRIVILGSGDIGMIMARRLTLEGAEVVMVVEIMDYLAGLTRNRVQCLDDFGIPLKLSHTITKIVGERRVEGVYVA